MSNSTLKNLGRTLIIPSVFMLGACCAEKAVEAPPPPPPPVAAAPIVSPMADVNFGYDSSEIGPAAEDQMKSNAAWLAANPARGAVLEGHCDERGTSEYNMALGERRANMAKDYLVRLGVDPTRLQTVSFGEEQPLDPGHTEDAWAKNRRVHFAEK
ncbi:MAG: peptidoglycan-associated lipoprotein Pal [Chlorobiaceae bacterium]|nr:peptidoglycan-associated lipoprotein Pal [Chlorobiaceae bacterium]NTW74237.1 peptidoglycan-associated lipoprotein Pal [Chlorobiaceae bacterium]